MYGIKRIQCYPKNKPKWLPLIRYGSLEIDNIVIRKELVLKQRNCMHWESLPVFNVIVISASTPLPSRRRFRAGGLVFH